MIRSTLRRCLFMLAGCGFGLVLSACQQSVPPRTLPEPAAPIRVSVAVDRPTITVGDLITYSINVDAATNVIFSMPQFAENLGGFVVRDWKRPGAVLTPAGRREQSHTYALETYLTGVYELPPATIRYILDGQTNTIVSTPICVEVVTVAEEGDLFSGIRDIKDPVDIQEEQPGRLKYIIIATAAASLVILAVIGIIYSLHRKNDRPVPVIPAHEIAYESLRRLHARNLVEQGRIKVYFIELSTILRHYIENQFGLRAPERTTEEFLQDLKTAAAFSDQQRSMLSSFLTECDLVKFANYHASSEDARRAHDSVVAFIEETREPETTLNSTGVRR